MHNQRHAIHFEDFKHYDTNRIRKEFLIEDLFVPDQITQVYTHYDRYIVGGVHPQSKSIPLETIEMLKADFYLQRRELGIINVGAEGSITVDGTVYTLKYKEALYIARGTKVVIFHPSKAGKTLYYFNSAPAHAVYPTRKVTHAEAETVELGSLEAANQRTIRKLLVNSVLPTCQLQM